MPKPAGFTGRNLELGDGARVELREVYFAGGLRYFHRYSRPKDHVLRGAPVWEIVCEKGALTDTHAYLPTEGRSFEKIAFEIQGQKLDQGPAGVVERIQVQLTGEKFSWESPYLGHTRQWTGIAWLLEGFLRAARNGSPPHYGLERAVQDVELWRSMELVGNVPTRPVSSFLLSPLFRIFRR